MADRGDELVSDIHNGLQFLSFSLQFFIANFDLCYGFIADALVNQR